MESERVHFAGRLLGGPMLPGDAVRGDHHAGAVFAEVTVDEDFLVRVIEKFQELRDLRMRRRRHAGDGNIDEMHAQRFGLGALPLDRAAIAAEIHDGGDAEFLQFGETLRGRLSAAEEYIADFAGIMNPGRS